MSRGHVIRAITACIIGIAMFGGSVSAADQGVSISGIVIDGRPGNACVPMVGMTVELADRSQSFLQVIDTTVSGAGGAFTFTGVSDQTWLVMPAPTGSDDLPVGANVVVSGSSVSGVKVFVVALGQNNDLVADDCTGLNGSGDPDPGDPGAPGPGDPDPGPGDPNPGDPDPGDPDPGEETPGDIDETPEATPNTFSLTKAARSCTDQSFRATWTGANIDGLEFSLSNTSDNWTSSWMKADPAAGVFETAVEHHGYDKVVASVTYSDGSTEQVHADVGTCTAPSTPEKPATPQKPGGVTSLPSTGSGQAATNTTLGLTAGALMVVAAGGMIIRRQRG